jgi:ATP-dependent exoDNAse (exonuclease V) beta subunit
VDLRGLLRLEREAADRGTLAHAWFETIGWLEDGAPADDHLRALAVSAAPDLAMEAIETLRARFRSWLDLPDIRYLLLRSSYPAGAEVEREVPFLHRADGRMVEGTIDRLILVRQDGKVVAAEVIDFKTDALAPDDPDALTQRARRYAPQLDAYRAAVRTWYDLPADAVKARLVFVDAGAVAEV